MSIDDDDAEHVPPGVPIYEGYGWTTFNGVSAVPILIPGIDGARCLFAADVTFVDSVTQRTILAEKIPFEVLVGNISSLLQLMNVAAQRVEKTSLTADTLLFARADVQRQLDDISSSAISIKELVAKIYADDTLDDDDSEITQSE